MLYKLWSNITAHLNSRVIVLSQSVTSENCTYFQGRLQNIILRPLSFWDQRKVLQHSILADLSWTWVFPISMTFSLKIAYCKKMSQNVHDCWFHDGLNVRYHANRPKNRRRFCNSFMWFIFNPQRRKIYTIIYSIQFLICDGSKCKNPLRWWLSVQGCEHPSTLVPCWVSRT